MYNQTKRFHLSRNAFAVLFLFVLCLIFLPIIAYAQEEGELKFDYKKSTDYDIGKHSPFIDKWPGSFGPSGYFKDVDGVNYRGVGMPGPRDKHYHVTYDIPEYSTQFTTYVFIDTYFKDRTCPDITYQILVDNNQVMSMTQDRAVPAKEVKIDIPKDAKLLTLRITSIDPGPETSTYDVVWGEPTFYHFHQKIGGIVIEQPTCYFEGLRHTACSVCGDDLGEESIPKIAHTPDGKWIITKETTCSIEGEQLQHCSVCSAELPKESIQLLPHSFSDPNRIRGSIFIPPVVSEIECMDCDYIEQQTDWLWAWVSPLIVVGIFFLFRFMKRWLQVKKGKKILAQQNKEFVCPYCFKTPKVSEVQFRCTNDDCPDVDDIELTKYSLTKHERDKIKTHLRRKRTFNAQKTKDSAIPRHAYCPKCTRETSEIICPKCHNPLPESTLTDEDIIISIVGSRDAGKSHFVGVIINELMKRVSVKFGYSMTEFDDTMIRYEQDFSRKLYNDVKLPQCASIPGTISSSK